ncbi:hypothetical protein KW786_03745 [Candidatus Parcubacteria bacterium]|nr:hypothetical protein [Candidatus Parcubacteria bacterium]
MVLSQDVTRDAWEGDDCLPKIAEAWQVGAINPHDWSRTAISDTVGTGQLVRVHDEPGAEEGYRYYRREVDIERRKLWEANMSFRVTAQDW